MGPLINILPRAPDCLKTALWLSIAAGRVYCFLCNQGTRNRIGSSFRIDLSERSSLPTISTCRPTVVMVVASALVRAQVCIATTATSTTTKATLSSQDISFSSVVRRCFCYQVIGTVRLKDFQPIFQPNKRKMNSSFALALLLQGLFCVALCLPVDRNPSTKHVEWIKEDTRSELLSPIDNLIEPEGTNQIILINNDSMRLTVCSDLDQCFFFNPGCAEPRCSTNLTGGSQNAVNSTILKS